MAGIIFQVGIKILASWLDFISPHHIMPVDPFDEGNARQGDHGQEENRCIDGRAVHAGHHQFTVIAQSPGGPQPFRHSSSYHCPGEGDLQGGHEIRQGCGKFDLPEYLPAVSPVSIHQLQHLPSAKPESVVGVDGNGEKGPQDNGQDPCSQGIAKPQDKERGDAHHRNRLGQKDQGVDNCLQNRGPVHEDGAEHPDKNRQEKSCQHGHQGSWHLLDQQGSPQVPEAAQDADRAGQDMLDPNDPGQDLP